MKRSFKLAALGIGVLAMAIGLGSCDGLYVTVGGNSAPVVSLSCSNTTPYSDEPFTVTATATDADYDNLSYSWYMDSDLQSPTSSSINALSWKRPLRESIQLK